MFANPAGYERLMGRWSRRLAEPFLAFAGIAGGMRLLDVGCGTGALAAAALAAAPRLGLVGIDPVPDFVAHARARLAGREARFLVADARRLPFRSGGFDAALALLVLGAVPAPGEAVAEMMRVTRPGGTVAACSWDFAGGGIVSCPVWDAIVALDPAAERDHSRHMPLGREGEQAALWRASGLAAVAERAIALTLPFESFADFWQPFLAPATPSSAALAALPPDRRAAAEASVRRRLLGDGPDRPFAFAARAWVVKGTVPAGP